MRNTYLLAVFLAVMAAGCKKDNGFSRHCEGLQQDPLPPGDGARIDIANAFTPNGDGINDYFRPELTSITSINMKIFDKGGNLIYKSDIPEWLPLFAPEQSELYYYRVEGITVSGKRIGKCGAVYALECFPAGRERNSFTFEDMRTPSGFTGVTRETIPDCP